MPPIPLAQIFGKGGGISPQLIKKIKKAANAAGYKPTTAATKHASKSSMKSAIDNMAALNILENCSGLPDMDDIYGDWLQKWRANSRAMSDKGHIYAVEVKAIVWKVVVDAATYIVVDFPSAFSDETRYEWTFDGSDVLLNDDNEVVYVPLPNEVPAQGTPDALVMGFFVPVPMLYIPETRKGEQARGGKDIDREVKFAKSKGGGEWTVLVYKDGTKSCNCPSWIFHGGHDGTGCKHTVKV